MVEECIRGWEMNQSSAVRGAWWWRSGKAMSGWSPDATPGFALGWVRHLASLSLYSFFIK